ncbi:MAG TPA: threonine/serine dehydratase [Acidobacteriaceae bacterium]|jgi:threonine dehydratase|nr:threonine/serine dehydratase [Acidobacteriaceae bacterium]
METRTDLVTAKEFTAARERLREVVLHTPLVRLTSVTDSTAYLKAESLQPIGSFKLRGASNAVAQLSEAQRRRGVITYSSGNHGQGVAYAARAFGVRAIIVMPANAPEIKRRATAALGAEIVNVGPASSERRERAEALAAEHGYAIIPPYDDPAIIAGQGTCGLEILEDCPEVDLVLAPVGGGGLLSGVAAAIRRQRPQCHIVGVEPELAGDAAASLRQGTIVEYAAQETSRTIADGLRTQSLGTLNFAHIQRYVERIVTVTEQEIEQAMRHIAWDARLISEPSGGVATAALLFHRKELPPHRVAVAIISGGNAEPATLLRVLGTA